MRLALLLAAALGVHADVQAPDMDPERKAEIAKKVREFQEMTRQNPALARPNTDAMYAALGKSRNCSHHILDIFADRGTPVRAVADGRVRTGTEGIGGNHIWLSSGAFGSGARYYYAHLDSFDIDSGERVEEGEVIGHVGNTGNARTTPPHLHFGVYTAGGPVDPAPFLLPPPRLPDE